MRDLKILWAYFKEHKIGALIVLLAIFIGAALGAAAYYHRWLG